MRNEYVADIADFAKYSLLRALCGVTVKDEKNKDDKKELTLGVVWYLVSDSGEPRRTDYLKMEYLNRDEICLSDTELASKLRHIVLNEGRTVKDIRRDCVLPSAIAFYEKSLSGNERRQWVEEAAAMTADCDVVFLDPDVGLPDIPLEEAQADTKRGPQHAYFDELELYLRRRQSLVVYQNPNFKGTVPQQITRHLGRLNQLVSTSGYGRPFCARFRRRVTRLFLVVPAREHATLLRQRARRFVTNVCPGAWALQE